MRIVARSSLDKGPSAGWKGLLRVCTGRGRPSLGHVTVTFPNTQDKGRVPKVPRERKAGHMQKSQTSGGRGHNRTVRGLILATPRFRDVDMVWLDTCVTSKNRSCVLGRVGARVSSVNLEVSYLPVWERLFLSPLNGGKECYISSCSTPSPFLFLLLLLCPSPLPHFTFWAFTLALCLFLSLLLPFSVSPQKSVFV